MRHSYSAVDIIYAVDTVVGGTGPGEGNVLAFSQYMGSISYPTPQLSVQETLMLPAGATAGYLLLVSSDSDGNTSELSAPIQVGEPGAVFKDGFETVVN